MKEPRRIQTIDRATLILECFTLEKKTLRLAEIVEESGLKKSTVYGLLTSLKVNGFLDQDPVTSRYSLGMYLLHLGSLVSSSMHVLSAAQNELDNLQNYFNETVHLGRLYENKVVYLDKRTSNRAIQVDTNIGQSIPAHTTGIGKCLLAHRSDRYIDMAFTSELETYTEFTIKTRDELKAECKRIRKKGFSLDNQENLIGLSCIAVPIFDIDREVPYALSISGQTDRIEQIKNEETVLYLKERAMNISKKLGYLE